MKIVDKMPLSNHPYTFVEIVPTNYGFRSWTMQWIANRLCVLDGHWWKSVPGRTSDPRSKYLVKD